ncbi:MAG: hypothetical protein LC751_10920 [Actinobacteria bacterium]|nr:hypothetical protein [Actinomycetota bacterium]MCA1738758.1 hypothetical protein [Actinomycetota bacterium]
MARIGARLQHLERQFGTCDTEWAPGVLEEAFSRLSNEDIRTLGDAYFPNEFIAGGETLDLALEHWPMELSGEEEAAHERLDAVVDEVRKEWEL